MTDQNEKTDGKKKKLSLSRPGKLELNKTVDAGQVRQSFSHGRTKAVAVEVRRKRTFKQADDGAMTEIREQAPVKEAAPVAEAPVEQALVKKAEAPARTLTDQERAARTRALEGARQSETEVAESRAEREAMESRRKDEESRQREQEEQRRKEEEERRRTEEEERHRLDDEAARRAAEQAARLETPDPAAGDTAKPKAKAKTELRAPVVEEEASRDGKTDPRKPAARRGDSRRRGGKLTISQALNDEERQRSLASVRRQREREKRAASGPKESKKVFREVIIPDTITVQELANRMTERAVDIIKALMNIGIMATITETIDAETAELVVTEFGHTPKRVSEADVEIGLKGNADEDDANLQSRPPVVTIMGHVDHGKTSLLDALRSTDVVAGEAGGITQHIGAYQVRMASGDKITFLDTPGHAAFTQMRARGADATDIVVLMVAADDGLMPQTIEAINHARAADVPIVVAVNKIDKDNADPQRVLTQLAEYELVPESWGGDTIVVEMSALQGVGVDELIEQLQVVAEIEDLQANPNGRAKGIVIEAQLDKGRGPVATILIDKGTLKIGDPIVAGGAWGKVRAMINVKGEMIKSAGPSTPVQVLGLSDVPEAGDEFRSAPNTKIAQTVGEARALRLKARHLREDSRVKTGTKLEDLFAQIQAGERASLNIILKADVQGSLEAVTESLRRLERPEVDLQFVHRAVGGITENDITLANATNATILGFNVRPDGKARKLAEQEEVEIRTYEIIYKLLEDIEQALIGMLDPEYEEVVTGECEVREIFRVPKQGAIAGCMVTSGLITRGSKVRFLRNGTIIWKGAIATLRRFKDDVREVREGFECGIGLDDFQDLKPGDLIETFEDREIPRS